MVNKSETKEGTLEQECSTISQSSPAMNSTKNITSKTDSKVHKSFKTDRIKMLFTGLSVDKEIKLVKPSDDDIINYSKEIPIRGDENFSLNFFLQEKYDRERKSNESKEQIIPQKNSDESIKSLHEDDEINKASKKNDAKIDYIEQIENSDKVIIADLRNIQISANNGQEVLDLQGANFRGSYFDQTRFSLCNLKNATFADTNLKKVTFKYSDITHIDFRGCALQTCIFGTEYTQDPYNKMKGVMLSMSSSELRIFSDIKSDIAKKNEEQRLLGHKKLLLAEISSQTKLFTKILYFLGFEIEPSPYKTIKQEIANMEKGVFYKNYIVQETIKYIFDNGGCSYYPIYQKFIQNVYDLKIKLYITLNKKELDEFLEETKKNNTSANNPNILEHNETVPKFILSLNEFAKKKYVESLGKTSNQDPDQTNNIDDADKYIADSDQDTKIHDLSITDKDKQIITDLSSQVNKFGNNEWKRLNLKGMIFENLDMSYVNFAGSDLSTCRFNNVILNGCNFNCCLLEGAQFVNCDLSDASMIASNLSGASFTEVRFLRSNLNRVNAQNNKLKLCNLSYISSELSDWSNSDFDEVKIDGANFAKAKLLKTKFVNSILNNCILNFADFSYLQASELYINNSLANYIILKETTLNKCKFNKLESTKSNWTGTKINEPSTIHESTQFTNCNFEDSIFDGLKVAASIFIDCSFEEVKIGHGKLYNCDFKGSNFRFAEFNNSVFSQCKAPGSDFSGASIFNTKMSDSIFSDTCFNGAKIIDSNLNNSKFDNSVWFNVHIKNSMMEKIDNHRIKINDVTEFIDCRMISLEGQFYYYDEEGFMEVMFIEQQRTHQQKIEKLLTEARKWKILTPFLKILSKEYNASVRERNKIILARRRNRNDLRMHYKHLKEGSLKLESEPIFKIRNIIRSHNYTE